MIPFPKREGETWIHALESGEYTQRKECLKVGDTYCAMGVLGKILNIEMQDYEARALVDFMPLFDPVSNALAAPIRFEDFTRPLHTVIVIMNDNRDMSFKEIAEWLKEQLDLYD